MTKAVFVSFLAGGLTLSAAIGLAAEGPRPALLPDATQAVIDGRVAVGAWPTERGEIVGPEGFAVHLVRDGNLEEERVYPAGHWFQPPPGRYKVWVEGRVQGGEGGPRITPSFTLLNYSGGPFRGRGLASTNEVAPAGWVGLHSDLELSDEESLRLLHLDPVNRGGRVSRGFLRAIPAERAGRPALMPAGRVVGLLYDRKAKRYLAASRPVDVPAGQTVDVRPTSQRGVSDLLVILHRTELVETAEEDDLEVHLEDEASQVRAPDLLVPGAEWVYALWYGVDGRAAQVQAGSGKAYLDPTEAVLEPGGVAVLRRELLPRPHLDVRLDLPPELQPEKAVLKLTRRDDKRLVQEQELPLDPDAVTRIEGLPPARLWASVILESKPLWRLDELVDLRDGSGREVVFRPRPSVLSGTIYHGAEPTPGEVTIRVFDTQRIDMEGATFEAEVDEDGTYRAVLYDGGRFFIFVDLPGVPGPPMPILHVPYIRGDTEFDIHVPRSSARVQVRDGQTGEPIAAAQVTAGNRFVLDRLEPVERGSAPSGALTGDDGWAELPPMYPGELFVTASKEGYLKPVEGVQDLIREGEVTEVVVELEPQGKTAPLRVLLPDGRPARGAEVRSQPSIWNEPPLWEDRTDSEGLAHVPPAAEGNWILVRHPDAASWIEKWEPRPGRELVTWTLRPAAGAVTFRTVGLDGDPVAWADFAVRLPRTWVTGQTLAWLTRSRVAASHRNALWTARHLPAEELRVYAGDPTTLSLAIHGLLEGTALQISPPWPVKPVDVAVSARREAADRAYP